MNRRTRVREYLSAWEAGNLPLARSLLAEGCTFSDPLLGSTVSAPVLFRSARRLIRAVESLYVHRIVEDGDWLVALYTLRTRIRPPLECTEWFRFAGDSIVEARLFYDTSVLYAGRG